MATKPKNVSQARIKELEDKNEELMKVAVSQAREINEAHAKIGRLILQNERQEQMIQLLQSGVNPTEIITNGTEEDGD